MTRREDLRKLSEVLERRAKKLDEIREFLSISPEADDKDVIGIMKWWQETAAGESSVPLELKTQANRLFGEFNSINDANQQILDRLQALDKRGE
jgi:hypothetical protein